MTEVSDQSFEHRLDAGVRWRWRRTLGLLHDLADSALNGSRAVTAFVTDCACTQLADPAYTAAMNAIERRFMDISLPTVRM